MKITLQYYSLCHAVKLLEKNFIGNEKIKLQDLFKTIVFFRFVLKRKSQLLISSEPGSE